MAGAQHTVMANCRGGQDELGRGGQDEWGRGGQRGDGAAGREPLQPPPRVTEVNGSISDTDQAVTTILTSVTHQTNLDTDQPVEDWPCMIRTFVNCHASSTCANSKCASLVVDDTTPDTVRDAMTVAKLANVTDQTTTATIPSVTDTIRMVSGTGRATPCTDHMYYPIYGEYYTGGDVTVDVDYATTTETW
ncbi:unnamed protein product [Phytophthora fragariaefolia]|uniref:Unnamed protein product n=1 Tax=Phytophthora fragariaefolia TaxID=1490495 RepID=A0A9W7D4L9_9STRA|nr:unnamed protein product [Phytophthora fragariaefolia]